MTHHYTAQHMQGTQNLSKRQKRKIVVREPSGRLSRRGERESAPTAIRRLRDAALRGMHDPEWGTELGRLYLEGELTDAMYAAGKRWAEVAAAHLSAIGAFPVKSVALQRGSLAHDPDPGSDMGQKQAARDSNALERFAEAHAVLMTAYPGAESSVRRLCEQEEGPCGFTERLQVRTGLVRLAEHWGLTGGRK